MCEHITSTPRCADCAPAPAAGHFGIASARDAVAAPPAPEGCPSLDEFEDRFSEGPDWRRPGTVSAQ